MGSKADAIFRGLDLTAYYRDRGRQKEKAVGEGRHVQNRPRGSKISLCTSSCHNPPPLPPSPTMG